MKVVKKGSSEQEENDLGQLGWMIYGYHELNPLPAGKKLILSRELKSQLNFKIDPKTTSLEKILKIHCLQYGDQDRPIKYRNSSMLDLYKIIAEKNGLFNDEEKPDYKLPIGEEIYKNGIIIDIPNVVYYMPDYLIAKHNKLLEKEKKKRDKQKQREEQAAKDKIWVKDNYKPILDKAKEKKQKFDETKIELISNLKKRKNKSRKFEARYDQVLVDINDVIDFDIVNTKNKKVISKLKELRRLKKEKIEPIELKVSVLDGDIELERKIIENLFDKDPKNYKKLRKKISTTYGNLELIISRTKESMKRKTLEKYKKSIDEIDFKNLESVKDLINQNFRQRGFH